MKLIKSFIFLVFFLVIFLLPKFTYEVNASDSILTEEELQIVTDSKTKPISVALIDSSFPVCSSTSDPSKYEGILVSMMELITAKTGLEFAFYSADVSKYDLETGKISSSLQLVLGASSSSDLASDRDWVLSNTIFKDSLDVVGLRGNDSLVSDKEKTIAVMKGIAMSSDFVEGNMPNYKMVEYITLNECLDAVVEGKVDTAVYLQSCLSYQLQKPYYENLHILPVYSESVELCAAAFSSDSTKIIDIINKGLQLISDDEIRTIKLNYTVNRPYRLTLSDTLYRYRSPIIVIVILAIFSMGTLVTIYLTIRKSGKKVQDALSLAEKTSASKGNFMSRMSHEIRTPLNAIIGYNTIAQTKINNSSKEKNYEQSLGNVMECLKKSEIASRHLLNIINDVLDMSAIESGKIKVIKERFDFRGLVSSLTTIFYSQAKEKDVDFKVIYNQHIDEWIIGDQMRVNQVLANLLSNAIKFTPSGGKVILAIIPTYLDDSIKISFEVKDTGIGMTEEFISHIWTPFEQADSSISRRFGGTGLGLSITKTLVDLMGGEIDVKSTYGEGAEFCVSLTFGRTEQPKITQAYDFSKVNALVVDDDESTCDYIRLLMTRNGVNNSSAHSGIEAIKAISKAIEDKKPYTVCLIDWHMPKMDGIETVKRIRDIKGANLPIIVITAYDFSEIIAQAKELGVKMFLSKPLFQSSVFNLLTKICGIENVEAPEKTKEYNFEGNSILLAEDNKINMEIAIRLLESTGLVVEKAWNGQEAVDKFISSKKGTYKAILMDVQMPIMDGYTATKIIRESNHPEATTIPIIAVTADAFAENVAESYAVGMNDHISKPFELIFLYDTLKKYIK